MTDFDHILSSYRELAQTQREKGTLFETLIKDYLKNDPKYSFKKIWTWAEWCSEQNKDARDIGIDLVAETEEDNIIWAIQCKFYEEDAKIYKRHIDSFFTESGKKPFGHRLIVLTTGEISEHVHAAIEHQHIPCSTLSLSDLRESAIDWSKYKPNKKTELKPKKSLYPFQEKALKAVIEGLKSDDRGKLIMACGTGKTLTSLRIAEKMTGKGKRVLFLVPSLSLLSQTLTEWTNDSTIPIHAFAVCSDTATGKRTDDFADIRPSDLAYPATTKADKLAAKMAIPHDDKLTVVFSTYQSIKVISDAQKKYGLKDFDLIICDEAHRTTGATLSGEDESSFVKVHENSFIKGTKRIYMTATPRIYGDAVKVKAKEVDATLCSMDDETKYGKVLYTINFSEAVHLGVLSDYKVLILAVDEVMVSESIQKLLKDQSNELVLDDATKIIGCWKALSKYSLKEDLTDDEKVMRRAVAFCKDIKTSKRIETFFPQVIEEYLKYDDKYQGDPLNCLVKHVDGTFNAVKRRERLDWLKEAPSEEDNACHILSNARCLSEGVDVPSLDAILFLNPRKSQVDIVQSVGRVMRRSVGKKRGYVILPIGVPAGIPIDKALADNERYKVVWQILQALRSHDDKFDAMINKIDLGVDVSSKIEVIAVTNTLRQAKNKEEEGSWVGKGAEENPDEEYGADGPPPKPPSVQIPLQFNIGEIDRAIHAKIVKKCGNRMHWEEWAEDVAKIAQTHITRITATVKEPKTKARKSFEAFLSEIRDDLNESITESEAIEMLAQHIITKPVFEALFEGYDFAANNPVSQAIQKVLKVLDEHNLEKESKSLAQFYGSVKFRAQGIESAEGKQRIVTELYDNFFKKAFPKMTEKLGIVYTPIEVVDFIIHSVNDVLKEEFGQTIGSKGVHILDPFTGTGTFITRLLQSGLIKPEELQNKYENEIHANEIVLLAYYIAAINIEAVYHSLSKIDYKPFSGICLTDTFQLYEKEDMISELLVDNSSRRVKQKKLDIRVILGNPPYSAGQTSANDNNANVAYPHLDEQIRTTYAAHSSATNKNALYDSYIRAIRWASDRILDKGVIAYVSNAGWLEGNATDGLRKCLTDEFNSIYVFNLRGNQRTSGELSRKEGGKIFDAGSRTPIAISLLVKNPDSKEKGKIYYHDIGDYLSRNDKLSIVKNFRSIEGLKKSIGWKEPVPDEHNDWLNQRDNSFDQYISLGDKKDKSSAVVFENYSGGVKTNRDAWCYNFSRKSLQSNMNRMIDFYNSEVQRFKDLVKSGEKIPEDQIINTDDTKISWNRSLKNDLLRKKNHDYKEIDVVPGLYRPYTNTWLYFSRQLNDMIYQMPRIFPNSTAANKVISITGVGGKGFSALMFKYVPDIQAMFNGQCFPLKLYEKNEDDSDQTDLFSKAKTENGYKIKDGITDDALKHFKAAYPEEKLKKEDIFYYIYGLLHSEDYRVRFADNLSKQLPRIPCVKKAADFWHFSKSGRKLADLHIGYETGEPYPVSYKEGSSFLATLKNSDYRVEGMKFAKKGDKSTVIYNHKITMTGIPLAAYEYMVNGKSALEWVMDRQVVKTDKASGIVNDCNLYATETMNDPAYPLKLFQRVITVSLETMKIVKALPALDI